MGKEKINWKAGTLAMGDNDLQGVWKEGKHVE